MSDSWIGKSISINCGQTLGVFQGIIKNASPENITIVRAFRNGVPLRKQDMEISISACDIIKMELIPTTNQPLVEMTTVENPASGQHNQPSTSNISSLSSKLNNVRLSKSKISPPSNGIHQSKVPIKLETKFNAASAPSPSKNVTKAIDIPMSSANNNNKSNGSTPYRGGESKKKQRREQQNDQTFGTSVDDPIMDEDFDFEKNLALFDKQAIWNEINGTQKPDVVRQAVTPGFHNGSARKYRHDENILTAEPLKLRQIEVKSNTRKEYVTDVGLLIPSISVLVRNLIQSTAELHGLTWIRQCDTMARAAVELAINLIGGARRLIPTNQHQWPTIVILCDQRAHEKHTQLGLAIGRFLASNGLKTVVYVKENELIGLHSNNIELNLYEATGNTVTNSLDKLISSDLVILSSSGPELDDSLVKWINGNRSSVMGVDPPVNGFPDVSMKCSIIPILPLEELDTISCGKLYLANLGIPNRFYRDAGVKYKSPFGHKSLIPLYTAD